MINSQLGLLRLVDHTTRQAIEKELEISFADLYDAADDVRALTRDIEAYLDHVLYGVARTDI